MTPIYWARLLILALLYLLTGKLGLLLAVPPGYATLIWPASGIALGMLVAHGAALWPGVLLGSFLLNALNAGAFVGGEGWEIKVLAAFLIACGSTLQALAGRALIQKAVGVPLQLQRLSQILLVLLLAGPVNCVIAATVGVATLHQLGIVSSQEIAANWFAWWSGDALGVLVFMPLVLLAPGSREPVTWRGAPVGRLPLGALLLLLLPLALTFYAWKATTEYDYQRGEAKFRALTIESEQALISRLDSYGNALLGAAGFIHGSEEVSRSEWRTYVDTVRVRQNFPGMGGLGWIEPVAVTDQQDFVSAARADGAPEFHIHPATDQGPLYVIKYVEPVAGNQAALGLNIAFEPHRLAAAERARDSGAAAITPSIVLVQDAERSPGFLLLLPIYQQGMPVDTVDQRRAALRGWTYAPLIARHFLDGLIHSHDPQFQFNVYDGREESADALIYSSENTVASSPRYTVRSTLNLMQRQWLVVWRSTTTFERTERSTNPLFILLGGLLFTALLALLLVVFTVRRVEHIEQMVGARRFALPLLVFLVVGAGAFTLYSKLRATEARYIQEQVDSQASRVEELIRSRVDGHIASLARMAARWSSARGTPAALWHADAATHVGQLPDLRALQWLDPQHVVRWIEPLAGMESMVGKDLGAEIEVAAQRAPVNPAALITAPLDGHNPPAFMVYVPVYRDGRFDGHIAALLDIEEFFAATLPSPSTPDFTATILYGGRAYYSTSGTAGVVDTEGANEIAPAGIALERPLRLGNQEWSARITPTLAFVAGRQSSLPELVLAAGLLVAALAALSVRYILISRLKSQHLAESLALNQGIISSSAHLVIAIDSNYRVMTFNRAAEQALGYSAAEVIGHRAVPWFLDAQELQERARSLSSELGETIPVGPRLFTEIPLRQGFETREWTFVRRDGSRFPVNVVVTPLRNAEGRVTGFLGVIEDIRVRKEVERLKSEFTAVVSHELRTPLTSIRGSLGLILGALAAALPQKVRDLLEIAQNNCERLVLLVNDILDIEKFSAGQMRFDMQPHGLADLLLQAVEVNEGYARRFNVQMRLAPTPEVRVIVDANRFLQVMSNLLSNAIKYSPAGASVGLSTEAREDWVRICVRDQGPGIPDSFRDRLFEKFSQADSSTTREKGGTGLGLHIARRFIEHMHGRIGFDSEAGRGTTFWVELPVSAGHPSQAAQVPLPQVTG